VVTGARVTVITVPENDGSLRITELTFLDAPALILVDGLRHIEVDKSTHLAYIAGTWKKFDQTYEGFVIIDVSIPYGGFTDRDGAGWDDRIRGFLPVSGIGAPLRAARVNGFRLDPKRHLIYAAVDSNVKDFDEADLVILRTCDCPELDASITLQSGGAGASPD